MKKYLFSIMFVVSTLNAQISSVKLSDGSSKNNVTDIVVVFKMHVDIGYTNWAEGVLQKYTNELLDKTIKSIEETSRLPKSEQFVWTIPSWPLKYMLENSTTDRKERLEKAIKELRIIPHALPATIETEASDLETLVRGLSFSSKINKSFGLPVARDAKLTDVPSHSRVLPTLLKNAGIDFLHIGCNPGSASPKVPTLFWWQGPDSSKLLTLYWAEYYGSGILPPPNWPYKTWLAMIHTHENTGAPNPKEVEELLRFAKEKMPNVNIKIGRLSDFYDLLMKEKPNLPVITEDMPDTWIHGYMSLPRETKLSKFFQRETYNTEILNSQLKLWDIENTDITKYIDDAVENMILYDEHTFGAAMSHGNQQNWAFNEEFKINKSLGNYDYIEGTWTEKANRIKTTEKIISPIMKHQLNSLAASVKTNGKRVVVYNPLPWKRSGRVEFFAGVYKKSFSVYGLKDLSNDKIIPVYEDYNLISFDADSIPPMGYKTYIPILEPLTFNSKLKLDEKNNSLENRYYSIKINIINGALISVYDKTNNKELVNQNYPEGFGQYIIEIPGKNTIDKYNKAYVKPGAENWANDEMIRSNVPFNEDIIYKGECEKVVYKNMGNAIRATVIGKVNNSELQKYYVTYTLYENQPYVEINWGVDGKKPNPLPEAGWLSFPFNIEKPEYRLYRTGGIVDPQRELIEQSNQDYYFINTSMTMFDKSKFGVVLNSPSSPGISIDSKGLFKFSKKKELTNGNVFVNLYNNQWGTNFTEWIEGSFSSKLYIWSYNEYDPENNFISFSEETRVPLKGVYFDGEEGSKPIIQNGIELNRKGILLTSLKQDTDKKNMLIRLWEQAGKDGLCTVTLPKNSKFDKAYLCNLREEVIDDFGIDIVENEFSFNIKANQPLTFLLK